MDIEIDQSIKIKDAQDTVLAFSDGESYAIIIPSAVKRSAEGALRSRFRKVRNPELKIFVAGLFLLLREYLSTDLYITIDQEWIGESNEASIKGMLLQHIWKVVPEFQRDQIRFGQIGRQSAAHHLAYGVHSGVEEADHVVTEEELLGLL